MLDLKKIRNNPNEIEAKLKTKDPSIDIKSLLQLDEEIRQLQTKSEDLKSKKNKFSKQIGKKKEDLADLKNEMKILGEQIIQLDKKIDELKKQLNYLLSNLPNIPMDDVPISLSAKDNVCIKKFKEKKEFSFPIKNHLELNKNLKLFDFINSSKIAGTNWPLYTNLGARLEWALLNYMIDTHIKNGFTQIIPPILCREEIMYGSGQLPKFEKQLFKLTDKDFNLYLIPTAEVVLNGINYDKILTEEELPLKYVSYTPCFRREAGAAGKNERGLIRTHQFNKVELFCVTKPEDSEKIFSLMLKSAEEVLQGLELHYKNMLLVTSDTSFAAAKTIDIEVWLPGQDRYYEVSSVSNCTDFQSRRSLTRYKSKNKTTEYLHTLNGSGVATSRLMVAILENNQQKDGSVIIPKVLHKYLEDEIAILNEKKGINI
ncbi:MAG: seryl-tRNA synthetase [Chlamydiae bacterium SM23_39]|nr:MAG: seryl-tRNA synthetase [Chlamydiae bacterium SM23_39]